MSTTAAEAVDRIKAALIIAQMEIEAAEAYEIGESDRFMRDCIVQAAFDAEALARRLGLLKDEARKDQEYQLSLRN